MRKKSMADGNIGKNPSKPKTGLCDISKNLFFPALCLILGMLSGYGMDVGPESWHAQLTRPWFNPPNWIFGPVWTALYILMGLALARIWSVRFQNPLPLKLFALQFAINLSWSPVFFHQKSIGWALFLLTFLWITTSLLLIAVRRTRPTFFLLLPYWGWITFALILNYQFYILNT